MHFGFLRVERIYQFLRPIVLAAIACTTLPVMAAEWRLAPFVEISETYSSNIALRPAGLEEDEYVTQINPGLSLRGESRRLRLSLFYQLQNLFYANVPGRNTSNQQMLGSFNSELVRQKLFFEGDTSYRQIVVDPQGDIGQGNISITGSRENIATTSLSPYFRTRVGGWSLAELRYSRDTVRYLDGRWNDSVSNEISGQLADANPLDRWTWDMSFFSRKVKYVTGVRPAETWQDIGYTLDYRLSRKFNVNARLGYENNEYQRGVGVAVPTGAYWNVGVTWRPTPRSNFVVGRGERYFGPVWNLDLTHRGRHSMVNASYINDLSTQQRALLEVPLFDQDGNPIIDPDTSEQVIGRIPYNEVFLRRLGQLSMEYRTLKSTTSARVYKEYREYQSSGRKEDIDGGTLSWRWGFSRQSSLILDGRIEFREVIDAYTDNFLATRATFERRIGQRLIMAADVRRTKRERNNGSDYTELLLVARLTYRR